MFYKKIKKLSMSMKYAREKRSSWPSVISGLNLKRAVLVLAVSFNMMLGLAALPPSQVSAAVAEDCNTSRWFLGIPTWYKYLDIEDRNPAQGEADCHLVLPTVTRQREGGPPLQETDYSKVIGPVLLAGFEIMLYLGGLIAVGYIIYGGFQYLISQGEPDRMKNARTTIVNAIVGLIIVMISSGAVNLIGRSIT
jgi:hypothetical protein